MKRIVLICLLLLLHQDGWAQGENNIWTFGLNYSIDFNTSPPTLLDDRLLNGRVINNSNDIRAQNYHSSKAVCDRNGQLKFIVKFIYGYLSVSGISNLYDRFENPIPGSNLFDGVLMGSHPEIVANPSDSNQFYLFYVKDGALEYSIVDMALNGGLGGIIPEKKNIRFTPKQWVNGFKIATVGGCTGIWLVVRSLTENAYLSYHITADGLDTVPVKSNVGLLPLRNYMGHSGPLKFSPNGKMASAGFREGGVFQLPGGLELYNFEQCSGQLKNPRLLETNVWVDAGCFSPDNSKLYTTENEKLFPGSIKGRVFQYDLNQPTLAGIIASKTHILDNPPYFEPIRCGLVEQYLGDLKLGPDGRIYIPDQHPGECVASTRWMTFHIIQYPNNAGSASAPLIEAFYSPSTNLMAGDRGGALTATLVQLPRDIVSLPPPLDTLSGSLKHISACFQDSIVLTVPEGKKCYRWDDRSIDTVRVVKESGRYRVSYFEDCTITVDSFHVEFVRLPQVPYFSFGCPGEIDVNIKTAGSGDQFHYRLIHPEGHETDYGNQRGDYTLRGLSGGMYRLRITSNWGCDTIMQLHLEEFPKPDIRTQPADTIINYGDTIMLEVSGAESYLWDYPISGDQSSQARQWVRPLSNTSYTVYGSNSYSCRDTGYIQVRVDFDLKDFVPNAFTPNGDGINDVFRLAGATYQQLVQFRVFNRLGQQVFSTTDHNRGWDGTYNGLPCDVGTYYYMLEVRYPDDRIKRINGDVLLIR